MAYTVNQLSKISGVKVRTLRFYHDIGLLMPNYIGENKYRYYTKDELIVLQQILFYKELGFTLKEIQNKIINQKFNNFEALESHRQLLLKNINRSQQLISTIDNTLIYLQGQTQMEHKDLYSGFDLEKDFYSSSHYTA